MVSHCACSTRVFRDRALHEHRRPSGLPSAFFSRVAWSILDCARRTSTFLSCAFREQEDDQATLSILFQHPTRVGTSPCGIGVYCG